MTPCMQQTQAETSCLFPRSMRRTGIFNRVIIVTVLLFFSLVTIAQSQFAGGSGTTENPYLVATADHLNEIRDHLDKHFRQTADIDLGVSQWSQGEGWRPIGVPRTAKSFSGTFDGNGHVIRNMIIRREGAQNQGLFGHLQQAAIRRVVLEGVDIQGSSNTGALAGRADDAKIENVTVSGTVTGVFYVGGVIGFLSGGSLVQASSTATVKGLERTGGLVGCSVGADLQRVASRGEVQGTDQVGGVVGALVQSFTLDQTLAQAGEAVTTGDPARFGPWMSKNQPFPPDTPPIDASEARKVGLAIQNARLINQNTYYAHYEMTIDGQTYPLTLIQEEEGQWKIDQF